MMTKIYLTVNIVCAVYILYRLWLFLFRHKANGLWDKLHRLARIVRVIIRRWRKKMRVAGLEREKHHNLRNRKKENKPTASGTNVEVIGKTRSVYIPDSKKAKEPVRSEPLPESDFIGEEDEISSDDVDDNLEFGEYEDLQEFVGTGLSEPDPDFSQAMTYEDLQNMVEVASGVRKGEDDTVRAVETLYSIQQSDIYEFIVNESGNKERIEAMLSERFGENGEPRVTPEHKEKTTPDFDWSQYI